jgi:hypothetical protein
MGSECWAGAARSDGIKILAARPQQSREFGADQTFGVDTKAPHLSLPAAHTQSPANAVAVKADRRAGGSEFPAAAGPALPGERRPNRPAGDVVRAHKPS